MATKPRQILPGHTWFVTSRAVGRQHRFAPNKRTVETLWYCLAVTAQKYEVQLHGFAFMSNHYHLVLTDQAAQLPDFMRDLNSLISKALNAFRGVRGENFERRGYNAVLVADGARTLKHCAYSEANPCRANLVERATQWESVTSVKLEYGQSRSVRRPTYGLWKQASASKNPRMDPKRAMHCGRVRCPEVACFKLVRPPCMNGESQEATRAEVRALVKEYEDEAAAYRTALGRKVLGMERAKRVRVSSSPATREGFFQTQPEVSGDDPEQRIALRLQVNEFVNGYRQALEEFKEKGEADFPDGTWWMRRCLYVNAEYHPSG